MCSCSLFFSLPLIFTFVAASFSPFFHRGITAQATAKENSGRRFRRPVSIYQIVGF